MSHAKYYNGKAIKEWAVECGVSVQMIKNRIKEGWTIEEAINTEPYTRRNKSKSIAAIAKENHMSEKTLHTRIKKGMSVEEAVLYNPKRNLVGIRSGKLVVEKEVEPKRDPSGRSRRQCLCLCDCGQETIVVAEQLISGKTKSCGCLRKEITSARQEKNLIGKRFGRWTIESEAFRDSEGIHWNAICDCGNRGTPTTGNLMNGASTSCGCYNREQISLRERKDIKGQKFFMLTAVEFVGIDQYNNCLWRCLCDCGREIITTTGRLLGGQTLSCGCVKSKNAKIIENMLLEKNIYFIKEKYFIDLKYVNYLYFDFCIFDKNKNIYLIEYQGKQHYIDSGDFGKQQREITDQMKKDYCLKNNIPLFEIRYDDDVEIKLNEIIAQVNPVLSSEYSEKV